MITFVSHVYNTSQFFVCPLFLLSPSLGPLPLLKIREFNELWHNTNGPVLSAVCGAEALSCPVPCALGQVTESFATLLTWQSHDAAREPSFDAVPSHLARCLQRVQAGTVSEALPRSLWN